MMTFVSIEEIEFLNETIGSRMTAIISGTDRAIEVVHWWCVGILTPTPEESVRLKFVVDILRKIEGILSVEEAKEWFVHGIVVLKTGRTTPARAIRDGSYNEVRTSAEAFIQNKMAHEVKTA